MFYLHVKMCVKLPLFLEKMGEEIFLRRELSFLVARKSLIFLQRQMVFTKA